MTDAELAKWLREELPHLTALNSRQSTVVDALTALVALLRETEATIASTGEWGDPGGCWCSVLSTAGHTEHCQKRRELLARLRVVLPPEGRCVKST